MAKPPPSHARVCPVFPHPVWCVPVCGVSRCVVCPRLTVVHSHSTASRCIPEHRSASQQPLGVWSSPLVRVHVRVCPVSPHPMRCVPVSPTASQSFPDPPGHSPLASVASDRRRNCASHSSSPILLLARWLSLSSLAHSEFADGDT